MMPSRATIPTSWGSGGRWLLTNAAHPQDLLPRHAWAVVMLPPREQRKRLTPQQISGLALAHNTNLDQVARGEATEETLWHIVGQTLTWSKVAEMIDAGMPEMHEQLLNVARLVERYGRTGRVVFTGTDYQLAKDGVVYMDQLAEIVDHPTAVAACEWAERETNAICSSCKAGAVNPSVIERLAA